MSKENACFRCSFQVRIFLHLKRLRCLMFPLFCRISMDFQQKASDEMSSSKLQMGPVLFQSKSQVQILPIHLRH